MDFTSPWAQTIHYPRKSVRAIERHVEMADRKYDLVTELRKISLGCKSEVDPYVLLRLIAEKCLGPRSTLNRNESTDFLERLYELNDPRD